MSALIFGVGVGLFIIIALWAIALLLCLVSLRSQKNIGLLGILAASFFTGFLLLLPIDSPSDSIESSRIPKIHDYYFIWRILLIIFLTLSAICGSIIFVYSHIMEPKIAKPIFKQHHRVD